MSLHKNQVLKEIDSKILTEVKFVLNFKLLYKLGWQNIQLQAFTAIASNLIPSRLLIASLPLLFLAMRMS